MVHRPADSRLLSSLLSSEKEYTKHLLSLPALSSSSLSSLSAYAAASPPPASAALIAVAGALAGADDALQRYLAAVETWQRHLRDLRDLEEEVGTVLRDREILVTRLIKASKSQKPTRDSLLANPHPASPTASSSSLLSSSKLAAAQAELQACEAHLAAKERILDARRIEAVREGLRVRCTALVECGWAWGEMGKEALRALEAMEGPPTDGLPRPSLDHPIPPPPPAQASPPSSLAPSQSASQTAVELSLPAAHAMPELSVPRHALTRRITEEAESDDDDPAVEVVENPRFEAGGSGVGRRFSIRREPEHEPGGERDEPRERDKVRERKPSTGFFGSIRGFLAFRHPSQATPEQERGPERQMVQIFADAREGTSAPPSANGQEKEKENGRKRWATRTDANLKAAAIEEKQERRRRGRGGGVDVRGDSSGEEDNRCVVVLGSAVPDNPGMGSVGRMGTKRLRKSKTRGASPTFEKDNKDKVKPKDKGKGKEREQQTERGWTSDGGDTTTTPAQPNGKSKPKSKFKPNGNATPTDLPASSSVVSTASAPAALPTPKATRRASAPAPAPVARPGESLMSIVEGVAALNRSASPPPHSASASFSPPPASPGRTKRHTLDGPLPPPSSLLPASASHPRSHREAAELRSPRAAKSPLRSALRNASREPSPVPPVPPVPAYLQRGREGSPAGGEAVGNGAVNGMVGVNGGTGVNGERGREKAKKEKEKDDAASISSYETGHEVFEEGEEDEEATERENGRGVVGPPLPPKQLSLNTAAPNRAPADSASSASTEVAPVRRKSVRVSLQPTFSTTPPALDDDDGDGRGRAPWSGSWREDGEGMWADSSEEDEEYRRAKRLLSRVARRAKKEKEKRKVSGSR